MVSSGDKGRLSVFLHQDAELGLEHIPVRPKRWPETQTSVARSLFSRRGGWESEWDSQLRLHLQTQRLPHKTNKTFFLSGQLRTLIVEAQSRGLRFVYALSPGQDIVFSSSSDVTLLKRKLRQVRAHLRGLFWSAKNTQRSSLHRCPTWVARPSPSSSMTSITPCARPTVRPSLPSPTLRSSSPTRSIGSWESHPSSSSAPQVRRWDLLRIFPTVIPVNLR